MTHRTILLVPLLCLAALLGAARLAHADTITYAFSGDVYEVDPALSALFSTTDSASGTFTIDSVGATDALPSDPNWGRYVGQVTFALTVGSGTWTGTWRADVRNRPDFDAFELNFGGAETITGTEYGDFAATAAVFGDVGPTTVFDSIDLSELFGLTLSDWPSLTGGVGLSDGNGSSGIVRFTVTSLNPVPEPASLALVGLGGLGLAALRRRRRATV